MNLRIGHSDSNRALALRPLYDKKGANELGSEKLSIKLLSHHYLPGASNSGNEPGASTLTRRRTRSP